MFWVDARDFGAIGDGRSDDTQAIQKAIDVAVVSSRVVYFSPGSYLIKSTIKITADNLKIIGAPGSVIIEDVKSPNDAFIPLLAQNLQDVIRNLSIVGITIKYLGAGPDHA